jgi:hypothetical protein
MRTSKDFHRHRVKENKMLPLWIVNVLSLFNTFQASLLMSFFKALKNLLRNETKNVTTVYENTGRACTLGA